MVENYGVNEIKVLLGKINETIDELNKGEGVNIKKIESSNGTVAEVK
ncbi:MAG: hypothetical protein Unbinned1693contig1002_41 [Prokaryotic dsDNA virus sp.]|jgi:hypothetical protein|nr:MAG: hypothetical protein Unbinned1693contig1002_41 [Prokaryotic dsDNA virus sp.]|tara:strand:+ start:777 stop:917 length:141 start_codon:yes stop_codon:yes gene_type:complete